MNDRFGVRMLNAFAHLDKQPEAVPKIEFPPVAVLGDGQAVNVLHDQERPAVGRSPGIENLRDGRMIHYRQRLAFGPEPAFRFRRVGTCPDQFQRNIPAHRVALLGEPDLSHSARTEFTNETVGANDCGRLYGIDCR